MGSYLAIRSVTVTRQPARTAGPGQPRRLSAEFAEGVRYFAHSKVLMVIMLLAIVAQLGTGAMNTLDIFFVTRNLHAAGRLYGLFGMAFGIGAIAGGLLAGRVVARLGARTVTWLTLVLAGLLITLFARQTWFPAGLGLAVLFAIPIAMVNAALSPLLMGAAPQALLGRVISVFDPLNQLASMTSIVVAGWLASTVLRNFSATVAGLHMGAIDLIFTAAGVLIVLAGVIAAVALSRQQPQTGMSEEPPAVSG